MWSWVKFFASGEAGSAAERYPKPFSIPGISTGSDAPSCLEVSLSPRKAFSPLGLLFEQSPPWRKFSAWPLMHSSLWTWMIGFGIKGAAFGIKGARLGIKGPPREYHGITKHFLFQLLSFLKLAISWLSLVLICVGEDPRSCKILWDKILWGKILEKTT